MVIRPVCPADAAEWLRMRTALWPDADHEPEIEEFLRHGASPLLELVAVAERPERRLAGFVEVGLRPYAEGCESSPVPFIEGWYVDADLRRNGVGRQLIRFVEEWARERGYGEIASDVELENSVSLAAHEALGYQEVTRLVCFRRSL